MILRIKNWARWFFAFGFVALVLFMALASYTNVPTDVTPLDQQTFAEIGIVKPVAPLSFEQEIALIRKVQAVIFIRAPFGDGIPEYEEREPSDLMRAGHGLCYDRSRAFDKAFGYLGFESRHVYLLYKENQSLIGALFHYGQSSHAVTEVKTSKGWLFVDSNTPWIALNRNGEPVNADDVWRRFNEFENAPTYLRDPWWAIRGMYSRKGHLYAPYVPFPEFNWVDFLDWMVKG